jgi:DNA repair exonuclease
MVDYAASEGILAVLIAGDMLDTSFTRTLTRNTVLNCIQSHPAITFFYLRGNHDDRHFIDDLTGLPDNLKLFGPRWSCYQCGRIAVYGCELPSSAGEYDYDSLNPEPDMINLVMMHGQVSESSGGVDWNIDLRRLRGRNIDYLALGHIHSYRAEKLDGRGTLCYPGCPEGRGFDECGEHGFVLLEINEETNRVSSRFVPFASRRLFTVELDVSECASSSEMVEAASRALQNPEISPGDMVRLELTGHIDAEREMDVTYIRKAFEGRYDYFTVTDKTRLFFDIQAHSQDRSLKGEFIRSVYADDTLSEEEKAEVIRCGLLALTGEEAV